MYLTNKEARLLIVGDSSVRFAAEILPDAAVEVPEGSVAKIAKGLEGLEVEWSAVRPVGRTVTDLKNKAPEAAPAPASPAKRQRKASAAVEEAALGEEPADQ